MGDLARGIERARALVAEARDLTLADRYGFPSEAHSVLLHPDVADALLDVVEDAQEVVGAFNNGVHFSITPLAQAIAHLSTFATTEEPTE